MKTRKAQFEVRSISTESIEHAPAGENWRTSEYTKISDAHKPLLIDAANWLGHTHTSRKSVGELRDLIRSGRPNAQSPKPESTDTDCPQCGAPMRRKTARRGPNAGRDFLGCSNYPRCKATRDLPSLPESQDSPSDPQPETKPEPESRPEAQPESKPESKGGLDELIGAMIDERIGEAMTADQIADMARDAAQAAIDEMDDLRPTITIDYGDEREPIKVPDTDHERMPIVLAAMAKRRNAFLVGPAGSGKSTIGERAAELLGLPFYSISVGPATPSSRVFGFIDAGGEYRTTPFREAFENGGLFLWDELDNGHPGTVAEANQAMANGIAAFPDGMVRKHPDFRVIATGNTFGTGPDATYVGRNALDGATLNRFVRIEVDYDEAIESALVRAENDSAEGERWLATVRDARVKAREAKLPIVISPRNAADGAALLDAGIPWDEVLESCLLAGLSDNVRAVIGHG